MAINKDRETRAIVLSEMVYKESSKIINLYTEEYGKLSVLAKGAMSAKSSHIALCQTFTHGRYFLRQGKSFYYLNRGILIESNLELRKKYESMIYGSLLVEIINRTTIEGKKNVKIYGLLSKSLNLLSQCKSEKALVSAFLLKYVSFMGYRPILPKEYSYPIAFLTGAGGIVEGSSFEVGGYDISEKELEIFNIILYTSLEDLIKIEFRENIDKIFKILIDYLQVNLEVDKLHSLQLLM